MIILFDGVCQFCNASVNFIIRHDKQDKFMFTPLQSPAGQDLLFKHQLDTTSMNSFVLICDERVRMRSSAVLKVTNVYMRSTAVLKVAKALGFPWSMSYVFIILPKGLRDGVYNWIARNRYKWFGKKDQCMVPDERVRKKFL
ncbi:DUF393 domain-containing protein [Chitinophaga sp. SYP-B3965]|uniref:thiol-disulfide oxidoreductase DCC family protein n=1 Tax=Chitinophaga sp. SYP-B3965 TaxID=2663120 RepID=UPI001299957F|nr:thiol-disulfide oxidoreductase DCC family protein [Chitinophaga sp. SYP-B3965]MRG44505.1 DUF393 domain-containing protein [Chitinophaga sp. SYP-B3965]